MFDIDIVTVIQGLLAMHHIDVYAQGLASWHAGLPAAEQHLETLLYLSTSKSIRCWKKKKKRKKERKKEKGQFYG